MRRTLGIVGAPSSAGAFGPGQEKAPSALRAAGLLDRLRRAGLSVVDHGDVPGFRWRPDPSRRDAQNIEAVTSAALAVSGKVRAARAAGEVVLVLGGDCTTELGTVLGHLTGDPALVYFDIHPDLNVPGAVPDGALDWMGVAHLIGEERGVPALRDIGPRTPLLPADRVLLFAQADRHSTAWERELIERRAMARITMDEVAADPEAAAANAVRHASSRGRDLLVHFDVDSIDFNDAPLSENTGQNIGLGFDVAMRAVAGLLAGPALSSVTICEINPDHGAEDGSTLDRFVSALVEALAAAPALR